MALRAFVDMDWSTDLMVLTPEEICRSEAMLGSAVYWGLREGRVVFEEGWLKREVAKLSPRP